MRNLICAAVVMTAPFAAVFADTAVWGGSNAKAALQSYTWATAGNWVDGYVPTSGDDVDMTAWPGTNEDKSYLESVSLPANSGNAFNTLYGVYGRTLQWNGHGSDTSYVLSITNANDFAGVFDLYGWGTFRFAALAGFTPVIRDMRVRNTLNINVPTSGTSAVVSNLFGSGTVWKKGSGHLEIGRVSPGTQIHVDAGTVSVGGHGSESLLAGALAKAAFHVDASAPGTVETNAEGKVTRWSDVRAGWPVYAQRGGRGTNKDYNLPTVAENFQNGLPAIDFGGYGVEADVKNTATNTSALRFSRLFTNVKDAFFVEADRTAEPKGQPPLFATGISSKIFIRQPSGQVFNSTPGVTTGTSSINNPLDLVAGDVRVDGCRIDPLTYLFSGTELKVLGYTPRDEATYVPMEMFAGEYGARFGGIRIGEALVFTNKLTEAERSAITRHLLAKWKPAAVKPDLSDLNVKVAGAATVSVADGEELSVGVLKTPGASVVKTGEGMLTVGRFDDVPSVSVEAGGIGFDGTFAPAPSPNPQPAANPFRHYDASDVDSVHYTTDAETGDRLVTSWDDQSGDASKTATTLATRPRNGNALGSPKYLDGEQNGLQAIDFGTVTSTTDAEPDSAAMAFDTETDVASGKNVREVFFVFRKNSKAAGVPSQTILFGNRAAGTDSNAMDFYPYYNSLQMFRPSLASAYVLGGLWTIDGHVIDNFVQEESSSLEYHVYHGAFASKALTTAFFIDRGGIGLVGGGRIGEVILYDRELTEQERVDTEAYLVSKWMDAAHPATLQPPSIAFGSGAAAKVGVAGGSVTLTNVSASSGTFVKTGGGALTVKAINDASLRNVTVEGGTLSMPVRIGAPVPVFRFDASDLSSLSYFVEDGVTNVTAWADTRGNGIVANAVVKNFSVTNPTLMTVVRTDGKARPCLDFGKLNKTDSAGMQMSKSFGNIREAHCVFTDANGASTMFVFTDMTYYNYHRYSSRISRNDGSAYAMVGNGIIEADSVAKDKDYVPKRSFEVLSFVPTANTHIGSIALDRTSSAGGCRISEMIAFSEAQSDVDRLYLERMLMKKWGTAADVDVPVRTNEFGSVTLRNGATFRPVDGLAPEFVLKLDAASGDGTIDAAGVLLADGASLSFSVDGASGAGDTLTVAGSLLAEDEVDVSVTFTSAPPRGAAATYTLVSATDADVDLSSWRLTTNLGSNKRCELVQSAGAIQLRVLPGGLMMIVR